MEDVPFEKCGRLCVCVSVSVSVSVYTVEYYLSFKRKFSHWDNIDELEHYNEPNAERQTIHDLNMCN